MLVYIGIFYEEKTASFKHEHAKLWRQSLRRREQLVTDMFKTNVLLGNDWSIFNSLLPL